MRYYTGFLTAAVLEAVDKLKKGEIALTVTDTALGSAGMTDAQYQQLVTAMLATVPTDPESASVWLESVPTTVRTQLAQFTSDRETWLKYKAEVTTEDEVAQATLRLYDGVRFTFNDNPNSNVADIEAKAALYTGLVITGSEAELHDGNSSALMSTHRKWFGSALEIADDSITTYPQGVDFYAKASEYPTYTGGKLRKAELLGDKARTSWREALDEACGAALRAVPELGRLRGYVILFDDSEGTPMPVVDLDSDVPYSWIVTDEITSFDSVLWGDVSALRRTLTRKCVPVDPAATSLDMTTDLAYMPDAGAGSIVVSDHYIYTMGLNMISKQAQVQAALNGRDKTADATAAGWPWWIILLILFLAGVLLYFLLSDREEEDEKQSPNQTVVVNIGGQSSSDAGTKGANGTTTDQGDQSGQSANYI